MLALVLLIELLLFLRNVRHRKSISRNKIYTIDSDTDNKRAE